MVRLKVRVTGIAVSIVIRMDVRWNDCCCMRSFANGQMDRLTDGHW